MEVSNFTEKLNKVDGNVYVIEEEVHPENGVYEAELQHDNINMATLAVFTGPKLTGERVQGYAVSTPSLMPWKRLIRIYSDHPVVYVSYETDGDTVEAEDINRLQDGIVQTQEALNNEIARAEGAEWELRENLADETARAEAAEVTLDGKIQSETGRAQATEKILTDNLASEVVRSKAAEKANSDSIAGERNRAEAAEKALEGSLTAETARAKEAEKKNTDDLVLEVTRANASEAANAGRITAEVDRAVAKENVLSGNIQTETTRAQEAETAIRGTISTNKPVWDDKYTRNEVDNKFSAFETAIDWKEAVGTFGDLASTYPHPEDGWTVNVKDTDYTYRWSGTAWVAISANAIPKATQGVDGLLSKEDKAAFDDANAKKHSHGNKTTLDKLTETLLTNWTDAYNKRHEHINKSVLDKITQTMLDNLVSAYAHVSDAVRHVTAAERGSWNDANSKKHTHGNKGILDGITQMLLDNWNAAFSHVSNKNNPHGVTKAQIGLENVPNVTTNDQVLTFEQADKLENVGSGEKLSVLFGKVRKALAEFIVHKADTVIHITAGERTKWNAVTNKVDKVPGKQLSSNDFSTAEKNKLAGIAAGAEVNMQPDWNEADVTSNAFIRNRPVTYPPTAHMHTRAQITDFPSSMPSSDVPNWAKEDSKPVYGWSEITGKPGVFPPTIHSHTKSQVTDMPTKLSQFTNDPGYITQSDVDISQNHTHPNKTVLDKLTQAMLDKLAGIAEGANKYVHPTAAGNKHIPAGGAAGQFLKWSADGTAVWGADNNTTYAAMKGATAAAAGMQGLVPSPAAGKQRQFLRGDGTWAAPEGTAYTHPDSGVAAGTYRSVAVNAQGHVTAGTNPTTLAGYGITDAAVKSHNHDSIYMKKGAVTWADLKGGS